MKKNTLVLIMLSLILVTSFSCKTDDEKIDNEDSVLTATNYIYEGDLRQFYLETKNAIQNDSIAVWTQILEEYQEGYPEYIEAQTKINEASLIIAANQLEISSIERPEVAFKIKKPILPPIVPTPSPCLCFDLYNSVENIVLQPGTSQLGVFIYAIEDESTIVNLTEGLPLETIPNTLVKGHYQPFIFEQPGFTGQAIISVQSEIESYSVLVNFHNKL
ncbi:MAG: hypothetical protein ABI295_06980 [Xanthomarina sp.]